MLFGTYFFDEKTREKTLVVFHRTELDLYNGRSYYTRTGGLTVRKIRQIIE